VNDLDVELEPIIKRVQADSARITLTVEEALIRASIPIEEGVPASNIITKVIEGVESGWLSYFFCCYRKFYSAQELFSGAVEKFMDSINKHNPSVQTQCFHFFAHWIIHHWDDFRSIKEEFLPIFPTYGLGPLTDHVSAMEKKDMSKSPVDKSSMTFTEDSVFCSGSLVDVPILSNFEQYELTHLAEQITLYQQQLWESISRTDVMEYKPPVVKGTGTTSVDIFIGHFNSLSMWTQLSILKTVGLAKRRQTVGKLLELCDILYKLRNYNAVFSIFSTFYTSAIFRLKLTLRDFVRNDLYLKFNAFISPYENYKAYRIQLMRKVKENIFLDILENSGIDQSAVFKKRSSRKGIESATSMGENSPRRAPGPVIPDDLSGSESNRVTIENQTFELPKLPPIQVPPKKTELDIFQKPFPVPAQVTVPQKSFTDDLSKLFDQPLPPLSPKGVRPTLGLTSSGGSNDAVTTPGRPAVPPTPAVVDDFDALFDAPLPKKTNSGN